MALYLEVEHEAPRESHNCSQYEFGSRGRNLWNRQDGRVVWAGERKLHWLVSFFASGDKSYLFLAVGLADFFDLLEDTVSLNIWSAAELAITMVCAGIPVLRPLLRRGMAGMSHGTSDSSGYCKHGTGHDGVSQNSRIKLDNLGNSSNGTFIRDRGDIESNHGFPNAHPKLGIRGATTVTLISRDNHSDEEILGPEYRHSQPELPGSIQIRERIDVRVEEVGQEEDKKTPKSAVNKELK